MPARPAVSLKRLALPIPNPVLVTLEDPLDLEDLSPPKRAPALAGATVRSLCLELEAGVYMSGCEHECIISTCNVRIHLSMW